MLIKDRLIALTKISALEAGPGSNENKMRRSLEIVKRYICPLKFNAESGLREAQFKGNVVVCADFRSYWSFYAAFCVLL